MFWLSNKSSSSHIINSDTGMNPFKAIAWSLGNRINNSIPFNHDNENVKISKFVCDYESSWQQTSIKASPSRRLSDLFWINLPWQKIQEELGTIHIVDVGCGKGTYGKKIQKWSNNRVESYTGIDINSHDTWEEYSKEFGFRFFEVPAEKSLKTFRIK
jgi:SAM-dependent methyltransferase